MNGGNIGQKVKIKRFFQRKGYEKSKLKQRLFAYLKWKLYKLYKTLHVDGTLDLKEIKKLWTIRYK